MQDTGNSHLKKDSSITAPKLHYISQFCRVQILFWDWTEKMNLQTNKDDVHILAAGIVDINVLNHQAYSNSPHAC